MADTPVETAASAPQPEPPADTLSRAERIFIRFTLWQTVLSVAGVVIAIAALYAALTESAEVRRQTAAAVWPFMQLTVADYDTGDAADFSLKFTNSGVGPARMQAVRLLVDGKPVTGLAQLAARMGGAGTDGFRRNFVSKRVFRPDETVEMIGTADPALARRLQAVYANPRNAITYCYCSIFDACWIADSRQDLQKPAAVERCPDFGDAAFQD